MRKLATIFSITILALVTGCSTEGRWISRDELKPSSDPNIEMVQLQSGSVLVFDKNLGWYDVRGGIIEGKTAAQSTRIPLDQIAHIKLAGRVNFIRTVLLVLFITAVTITAFIFLTLPPQPGF